MVKLDFEDKFNSLLMYPKKETAHLKEFEKVHLRSVNHPEMGCANRSRYTYRLRTLAPLKSSLNIEFLNSSLCKKN